MAHFMKTFRKHRKAMLAVLTLLAMFSFVFLGTIYEIMQTGRGRRNPVVVKTTKYGSLNERQLQVMRRQREVLYSFLRQLGEIVRVKGGRGGAVGEALRALGNSPSDEEATLEHWLQARKAEELGLKVSDEAVNSYLAGLSEGKAGNDDVRKILRQLRIGQPQLFEALRQEMKSTRLVQMFWYSLAAATPDQRWEYYQQLNRRAKIEAVPVTVSKFVDKVAAPSDDQVLRDLFEKYKDKLYDPASPEPGFREPHRIDLEYLKASVESFMDPASVTEQAIRDYYEAKKDQLYKDMLPEAPPPVTPKSETPKPEPPKAQPKAEPGKAAGSGQESAKQGTPKGEPVKPEAAKPAPATAPAKSGLPKAEPPKSDAPKGKADASAPGKTSSLRVPDRTVGRIGNPSYEDRVLFESPKRRSPFRLVAEQKTVASPAGTKAEPSASKSAPEAPKAEAVPPKAPAPLAPPAAKSESPGPKTEPAAKAEGVPGVPSATGPAGPPPVKYKPLADVKDEIRKAVARQDAEEKVRDVLRRVQDRLNQFQTQWTLYDTQEPKKKEATAAPIRPDFVALAKENRLTAAETGLVPALKMRGTDIGASRVEGRAALADAAYEKHVPLFQPGVSQDSEGNGYVYWKVKDSPERVPEFDEPGVRQEVLDAWKLLQARELATKEAERIAAEARSAKKTLAGLLAGRKDLSVLTPEPFPWMTFGNVPVWFRMRPPHYSQVAGIPQAGTEFMRAVFGLKAGEIGVAGDQSKATIYVVRLAEYLPGDSVLWDMFVADDFRSYAAAAGFDQEVAARLWREEIRTEAGVQWQREPFRGRSEIED